MSAPGKPVIRQGRMVCFDDGEDRFQLRAAGIAIRQGRVLVQNISGDAWTFIPGGRVDQHETTRETVVREIEEEFGRTVEVGPLLFVIESFFPDRGKQFHEMGFYFGVEVPDDFPYHESEICHRCMEGTAEMEYRWVPATAASLMAANFVPSLLRDRLQSLPTETVHLVDRER